MIKKIFSKFNVALMAVMAFVFGASNVVKAAADPDLTASLASTTAIITDNKGVILSFIVGALLAVFIIALSIKALRWVFGMILGLIGGRRKGRRR